MIPEVQMVPDIQWRVYNNSDGNVFTRVNECPLCKYTLLEEWRLVPDEGCVTGGRYEYLMMGDAKHDCR